MSFVLRAGHRERNVGVRVTRVVNWNREVRGLVGGECPDRVGESFGNGLLKTVFSHRGISSGLQSPEGTMCPSAQDSLFPLQESGSLEPADFYLIIRNLIEKERKGAGGSGMKGGSEKLNFLFVNNRLSLCVL